MKELKLSELTLEEKIGQTMIAFASNDEKQIECCVELIKKHALGGVYIPARSPHRDEYIARIKEAADYPVLVMCDAEDGIDDCLIGSQNALGMTANEDLAYIFGKVLAVKARKLGYNVIGSPVVDMVETNCTCAMTTRSLGGNKYKVAALAENIVRGLHDGGIISVAKHYPGTAESGRWNDEHMAESVSPETEEELLDYNLYPYLHLMKKGLLDAIMTKHAQFTNIDPDYPASLSKKCIDIIRSQGFDGLVMTDALCMMGVVAKFGKKGALGRALAAGNDITLPFHPDNGFSYDSTLACYNEGVFDEKRLDEAVRRVLDAQHKAFREPKVKDLTDEDLLQFKRITRECVYARLDEGLSASLDRNGRYFFAVLTESSIDVEARDQVDVDQLGKHWYNPFAIADQIKELFPNSAVYTMNQFPANRENARLLDGSVGFDSVVFITFFVGASYIGTECLTSRIISVIKAMQLTKRISTILHFGNPFVLEDLPHIPRVIIGSNSKDSIKASIDVLAGLEEPKGSLTYEVNLK